MHQAVAHGLFARVAAQTALDLHESAVDAVAHGGPAADSRSDNGDGCCAVVVVMAGSMATAAEKASSGSGPCCADFCAGRTGTATEKAGAGAARLCGSYARGAENAMMMVAMAVTVGGADGARVGRQKTAGGAGLSGRRVVPMHIDGVLCGCFVFGFDVCVV